MAASDHGSLPWVSGRTIGRVFQETVLSGDDRDALAFPRLPLCWSWRELGRRVDQVARALLRLGVERGEHVGIWSMNVPGVGRDPVRRRPDRRRARERQPGLPATRVGRRAGHGRRGDVDRRRAVQGLGFRRRWSSTLCPEAAAATTATGPRRSCPVCRRLIALATVAGAGLDYLGRPRSRDRAAPAAGAEASRGRAGQR